MRSGRCRDFVISSHLDLLVVFIRDQRQGYLRASLRIRTRIHGRELIRVAYSYGADRSVIDTEIFHSVFSLTEGGLAKAPMLVPAE